MNRFLSHVLPMIVTLTLVTATTIGLVFDVTAQTPQRGGTLRVALNIPITSTDPGVAAGTPAQTVRKHVYETLVQMTEDGQIRPGLAESWEVSADRTTWTFNLRKGVKFHDGTPFTAHAVKASLERILDPENALSRRHDLRAIKSVHVVDDYTVQIVTDGPFGPLLAHLALDVSSIVSPAAIERYGKDLAWNPVGTGPFKYESHVPEQSVTLVRNEEYWGEAPYLDRIIFLSVPETNTRITMLEAGEVDVALNIPGHEVGRLESHPDIYVRIDPTTRVGHIGINISKAPFNDVRVRQALNYAVNREAIVQGVLRAIGQPADSITSPVTWGYYEASPYQYNPAQARRLLTEAGYPNGFSAKLWTPQGRYYMDRETAIAVQAQLRQVGINLEVETIDWASYLQMLRQPVEQNQSQLYLLGWEAGTADIAILLDTVFASEAIAPAGWNTMFYHNPRVDELILAGKQETDQARRQGIYAELQTLIMEDAPWVPLHVFEQTTAVRRNVQGIRVLPTEVHLFMNAWKAQ